MFQAKKLKSICLIQDAASPTNHSYNMKISQQKQQTLRQDMSDSHINLEPQFFQNHPHHQQLPTFPSPQDYAPHQLKNYQTNDRNNNALGSSNYVQNSIQPGFNKFYQEYKRILSVSYNLHMQKQRLKNDFQQLQERLIKVQDRLSIQSTSKPKDSKTAIAMKKQQNSEQNRNRRARRTAQQIQKKFKCQAVFCQRYYGSEGSLQQHIKLKHPELLSKDSEQQYIPQENKEAISE